MKKFICIISILAIIFSLCACGAKETPTASDDEHISESFTQNKNKFKTVKTTKTKVAITDSVFREKLEKLGFQFFEGIYPDAGNPYWDKTTVCTFAYNDNNVYVLFAECQNEEDAKHNFNQTFAEVTSEFDEAYEEQGKNYIQRTCLVSNTGRYNIIMQIDSTVFHIIYNKAYEDNAQAILDAFNY